MGDDEWRKASTEEKVEHKVILIFKSLKSVFEIYLNIATELESSCRGLRRMYKTISKCGRSKKPYLHELSWLSKEVCSGYK